MEKLFIEGTAISPKVIFNMSQETYEITGTCRPEHASDFFNPVINWLERFANRLKNNQPSANINFVFNLDYINSVSIKLLFDCFKILEGACAHNNAINILWHYKTGDTDMKETGEEYQVIVKMPFKLIEED